MSKPTATPLGYISYAPHSDAYALHAQFPTKEHRKQYDIEQILNGQYSSLYIDPALFKTFFDKELHDLYADLPDFLAAEYQAHRFLFPSPVTQDTFAKLMAFGFALMHVRLHEQWENEAIERTMVESLTGCSLEDFHTYREVAAQRHHTTLTF